MALTPNGIAIPRGSAFPVCDAGRPVSLEQLVAGGWGKLLSYPRGDIAMIQQCLTWLKTQGIHSVYSYGPKPIDGFHVLGLGYGGLVMLANYDNVPCAIKVRRSDSPRDDFQFEAGAIATANSLQVGPQLLSHHDDCLVMEYLSGPRLIDWLHRSATTLGPTWAIIQQLLDQAFSLDQAGLDHGDLRCVTEHVHIEAGPGNSSGRPVLIDFGKASRDRRPANVTTLTQGLFLSTTVARTISKRFSGTVLDCQLEPRRSRLIRLLRDYKKSPCQDAYKTLLNFLQP